MEVELGLRVVRGPDWQWGDQDGGEGHVGTLVEVGEVSNYGNGRPVVVQWDCGQRCRYRCGVGGKYDLRVLDSAPTGLKHTNKRCHGCREESIAGVLWQCAKCCEYFLCTPCYMAGKHSLHHGFLRIDNTEYNARTWVPARAKSRAVEALGIYPRALVVRGHDWRWKNQDGGQGTIGEVIALIGQKDTSRSVVEVMWKSASKKNIYRVGHKGKVDLALIPGGGRLAGYYYPQHLTVLGAPSDSFIDTQLAAGDRIKVELDPDVWRMMQDSHGGWNEHMAMFIGMTAVVMHVDDDGDLMVNYSSNAMFHINAAAATKVEGPVFHIGDVVRVMEDLEEVMKLQKGHGEWIEVMQRSLGQIGQVIKVLPNGDIRLSINGQKWVYNPGCLKHAPGENFVETETESDSVSLLNQVRLDSLGGVMSTVVIEIAAQTGKIDILKDYFTQNPGEINVKNSEGKSALHIAIGEGLFRVVEVLLEFHPDVDIQDKDGDTPLIDCAHHNSYAIAEALIKAGANVNLKNHVGLYPIVVAAALGHYKVLKVLVKAPNADLALQDMDGNTALHVAVTSHRIESVAILLEAGADPGLYNHTCFNPLLKASMNGFYGGMEQFLAFYPDQVNMTKLDDGHTALHISAANDHLDVVQLLASLETCNIDAENMLKKLTPLQLAAQRGYSRIIECLVGYGANINTTNTDGFSLLHVVVTVKEMNLPSEFSPELMKVQEQLKELYPETFIPPHIILVCFLMREGAERHSSFGIDALQLLQQPDQVAMVERYCSTFPLEKKFRGSLRRYPPEAFVIGNKIKRKPDQNLQEIKPEPKPALAPAASPLSTLPTSLPHPHAITVPSIVPPLQINTPQPTSLDHPQTPSTEAKPQSIPTNESHVINRTDPIASVSLQPPLLATNAIREETAVATSAELGPSSPVETDGIERTNDSPPATSKSQSSQQGSATESEQHMCMLCDNRANIMFKPCGHVSMCSECAHPRVKKCPSCKSLFQTKTELR